MSNQGQVRRDAVTIQMYQCICSAAATAIEKVITSQRSLRQGSMKRTREEERDKAMRFPFGTVPFEAVRPSASRGLLRPGAP